MLGDIAVGKTSRVSRYVHSTVDERNLPTVGVKIDTKKVSLPSGDDIKLVLWDIAGKSAFARIDTSYLRDASAYLLVVDGTRPATLEHAIELQVMTEEQLGTRPFGVLLNKIDLNDRWALDRERIAGLESRGWVLHETSALNGAGVEAAFTRLGSRLVHET